MVDHRWNALLVQVGAIVKAQGKHITRLDEVTKVQAQLITNLTETVEDQNDELVWLKQVVIALYPRNEYGLTEAEARLAHACIQIGLHGMDQSQWSQWKPWPLCHCQRDTEASEDARALYISDEAPLFDRITTVDETDS